MRLFSITIIIISVISLSSYLNASSEKIITIVYTNSLNGNFDFCHCKGNPNGGLVKRATEIKKIRNRFKNVFLFETGDFFTYDPDPLLAKYLIKGYRYINYDALCFGDQEFSIGIETFARYSKALPFVCNNLLIKRKNRWERLFKRSIILKKGEVSIGIIGTISNYAFKYHPKKLLRRIKILDQNNEIRKDIKQLKRKGVDIIVLLSHSGYAGDRKLQKAIKGINVIVGGHSQTLIKKPDLRNNSVIVQAGTNGAHIGILEMTLKNGRIKSLKNSFRRPDEFRPKDNKHIRKLINSYKADVKKELKNIRFK